MAPSQTETGNEKRDREQTQPGPILTSREVKWETSDGFAAVLEKLNTSLLFSTYQTGHLVAVSANEGQISLNFHTFERPMGVAIRPGWLAVGSRTQIWSLRDYPEVSRRFRGGPPPDACYLTRFSHFTGDVRCHELSWVNLPQGMAPSGQVAPQGEGRLELWFVNTLFSCLCATTASHSFAPRWVPPFIRELAPEDRCHLNGLAVSNGIPRYVTALGESNIANGWREKKIFGGCIIDVIRNEVVRSGLTMPHSPRLWEEELYFLHSGVGELVKLDTKLDRLDTVAFFPGYTRGMAIVNGIAFVGLSKVRQSSGDPLPLSARNQDLKCGCSAIELKTGKQLGFFEFTSGIEELFDIQLLPGIRRPFISGPFADRSGGPAVWALPD